LADVWRGVGQEVTSVLDALITGTEDWNDVLKNTLQSLSRLLLQAGLSAIGNSSPKGSFLNLLFGGTRAAGGPVSAGTSYLVGEKGPELFTPSSSGNITPNNALGGNTVVNITINENGGSSSSSQGDKAKEALALGRMVESSVVAIITREKRPGGILTRA
jgi:phage-related minor tail protein